MLSSISRLAGLVAITLGLTTTARADVPIPIMPTQVAPLAPAPLLVPAGPQKILLKVTHPCNGCCYDVPVCLPACCVGAPCVTHHRTLIGCGRVVYRWSCGHCVVIRFPRHGGYRVVQG
ncbi:MAG: hypothetical protein FJ271_07425 [Planctomycetes bacterium]|nr:hypothetical protein [Planctomycetota bacterium]